MSTPKLFLLGSPRVEQDGKLVEIPRHKALALLAYLAITRERYGRDALASLLWPEADASHARGALRRALSDIGKALSKSIFDTTGESIAIQSTNGLPTPGDLWVDAHSFHALVAASVAHPHASDAPCSECLVRLTQAATLYRDDFMQGFTLPDCPRFDEWQFFQTETSRQELAIALERLVHDHTALGNADQALLYARRWSSLDPLLEAPQRAIMELYASSGQRSAALRQFNEYGRMLEEELNAQPRQELVRLAESIRRGELAPQDQQGSAPSGKSESRPDLQDQIRFVTVLFVGLEQSDSQYPDALADSADLLEQIVVDVASRYGGHVSPFLAQGIQVLFGFAQMHEDDPERALRAALAIRETARERRVPVSVGVSTGRVYFGPKSADGSQVTTIGPVVGMATRLQARAPTGRVLVGESTFRQTHAAFGFSPVVVDIAASGGPVKAFELTAALAHPDKVRGIEGMRAELIGRDHDLQRCKEALAAVLDGKGGVLSIVGEAGIGKSRLVEELAGVAKPPTERKLLWLSSRCSEFSDSVPYSPFVDLLGGWLDTSSQGGLTRAESLSSTLDDLASSGSLSRPERDEIALYVGRLLSLLSIQDDSRAGDARPELVLHQTFRAVNDLLIALARRQPLVLVFEDLHWADAISLDLLTYLVEATRSTPILLVCVYRPEPPPKLKHFGAVAAAKCPDQYIEVLLRELSPDQSRQMVRSMLQAEVLPRAIDELLGQVWGNPFFVEETVRALIETGLLFRSDGEWNARSAGTLPVPDSIQSVILSRVDRLPPELKRVLYAAAVIGRLFQPKLLKVIVPPGTDVESALYRLEEAALIYQDRVLPQVTYSFKHVLTQETVYQILTRQQREELHQQVATATEQMYPSALEEHYEELAHHYAQSRAIDKAVEYLVKAGTKSRRAFLNQAAIEYFDRALQLVQTAQPAGLSISSQVDALTGLGRIYHLIGRPSEAEHNLRQAIELGQRAGLAPRTLARINYWLGQVLHWQGRYGEEMWLGESGLAALSGSEAESVEAAMMNEMIASGSIQRGDRDRFHLLGEQNALLLPRLPYAEELPSLYEHVLLSLSEQKKTMEFQHWLEKLDHVAREHNDRQAGAIVHEFSAHQAFYQGHLGDALAELDQALSVYASTGDSIDMWRCLDGIAWLCLLQGNTQPAQDKAWQALGIAEKRGFHRIISESYLTLAIISSVQHDRQTATAQFAKAVQFAQGSDRFWTEWAGMYGLGRVSLAEGKTEQARRHFEAALLHMSPQLAPLGWEQHRWWSLAACILGGLETACVDQESFRSLCNNLEEFELQHAMPPIPMQWYAEPATPDARFLGESSLIAMDPYSIGSMKWLDPFGDCSYSVDKGIEIQAANGRDLWYLNTSSPRFVRSILGNCAVEAICSKGERDRPAMGGLLLWKDESNMLRLVWGTRGENEVCFEGCVDDADLVVGRGQLPVQEAGRVWLRLERWHDQVRALASADGTEWHSFGQISFPVSDPVEIGIHAVGWIDRTVYPGDYRQGTAIRFESFRLKEMESGA